MTRHFTVKIAAIAILGFAAAACETTAPTTQTQIGTAPVMEQPAPPQPVPVPVLSSAPLDTSRPLTRIAFGSCSDQDEPQEIWRSVLASDPDVFLFMGDNVYGDLEPGEPGFDDPDLPVLKKAYQGLAESEPFAALRAEVPVLPVWDDHDYGMNDGGANYPLREQAEELFETVWDVPATDARRQRPGIYRSWMIGDQLGSRTQIIMLDTRYFRSSFRPTDEPEARGKERYVPEPGTSKTILGEAQWRWLNAQLQQPADLRIIVSSIQVIADGHGWEAWKMLPAERERLYNIINSSGAENVIMLSGDRHAAALYRKDLALAYPLYEATSSSLNRPGSYWREESGDTYMEPGPNRLGDMYYDANFGLLEIDWQNQTLAMKILGADGAPVRTETIDLSDLRPVY